jgi:hypothetical protein
MSLPASTTLRATPPELVSTAQAITRMIRMTSGVSSTGSNQRRRARSSVGSSASGVTTGTGSVGSSGA